MTPSLRVAALMPYCLDSVPSQRFRWEQWAPLLSEHGVQVDFVPFGTPTIDAAHRAHDTRAVLQLAAGRYPSWLAAALRAAGQADVVVVHRNAALAGPPIAEGLVRAFGDAKMIYDLDDAVWMSPPAPDPWLRKALRCDWRVEPLGTWADTVSAGSPFLASHMRQFNDDVVVWPTTVSLQEYRQRTPPPAAATPVIGWTGSHSTAKYIEEMLPMLRDLHEQHAFELLIMGAEIDLKGLPGRCVPWRPDHELDIIAQMDIGLMPLTDDPWSRGKCGLKALQYLGVGTPAVVSDVGVNAEIVHDDEWGYVVHDTPGWHRALGALLSDRDRRVAMGEAGRDWVAQRYSAQALAPQIADKLYALTGIPHP